MARLNDYPNLTPDNPVDQKEFMRVVTRERTNDIKEFENLQNRFMAGRKVGKIPAGAATASTDKLGDFSYDENYFYIVVNNSGTAEWRRIAYTAW